MSLVQNMPQADRISRVLRDIFGREVSAAKAPFAMVNGQSSGTLGVFNDADGDTCAVVYMDLALSCASGAALSMIPPAQAKEAEATGTVPENILENLVEVYNIGRSWFEAQEGMKLDRVEVLPKELPRDMLMLLMKPAKRLDATIQVAGYNGGRFSLCVKG